MQWGGLRLIALFSLDMVDGLGVDWSVLFFLRRAFRGSDQKP